MSLIIKTLWVAALFATCAYGATPIIEAKPVREWHAGAMVAAANPLAVDAGIEILKAGGSAVDAAIAIQAVLGLVEPQSSGLGGGSFMLYYDAASGDVISYDGRESAPKGASADMFLDAGGQPLSFLDAVQSGRSVGVPGTVAMLALAHGEHGRLPWPRSWQRSKILAEQGFQVSPRLNMQIIQMLGRGIPSADFIKYFTTDGHQALPIGFVLQNSAYASTVSRIAQYGPKGFYEGPIAAQMVAAVMRAPMPGTLSLSDLKDFKSRRLEPICGPYRVYLVCGMRPPSSGGITVLSILGTLQQFDIRSMNPSTAQPWHYFIEAQRLAFADRDLYLSDERYMRVPQTALIDRDYLRSRAALIQSERALESVSAGQPPGALLALGKDATGDSAGTSHFVVVDSRGNVVSMTTTVESIFGSQRMAAGFFLNNQLTDFSFRPVDAQGQAIANAVAPGKKPRSSMAPTIIFKDGVFELALGSPGSSAIIPYVSKSIIAMIDWDLTPQKAINLPNIVARGPITGELNLLNPPILVDLKNMGHVFRDLSSFTESSGLHVVRMMPDGTLAGGADLRREGKVVSLKAH